ASPTRRSSDRVPLAGARSGPVGSTGSATGRADPVPAGSAVFLAYSGRVGDSPSVTATRASSRTSSPLAPASTTPASRSTPNWEGVSPTALAAPSAAATATSAGRTAPDPLVSPGPAALTAPFTSTGGSATPAASTHALAEAAAQSSTVSIVPSTGVLRLARTRAADRDSASARLPAVSGPCSPASARPRSTW